MTAATDPKLSVKRGWPLGAGNATDGLGSTIRNALDENFFKLIMVGNLFIVKSRVTASQPGSPADGDCHIQSAAWGGSGGTNYLAGYDLANSIWRFIPPVEGFTAYVLDEHRAYRYDGSAWSNISKADLGLDNVLNPVAPTNFASFPAANSKPAGTKVRAPDVGIGTGSEWITDGATRWSLANGECILLSLTNAMGLAPTGTFSTGSSGNWTSGTALTRTFEDGIWLYFGATATTPALTAGLYYVEMSSTTVGTIYTNGPGSAAYNFTGGAANTGVTGSAIALASVALPANLLRSGANIEHFGQAHCPANANVKTARLMLTGTNVLTSTTATQSVASNQAGSTTVSMYMQGNFSCRGTGTKQKQIGVPGWGVVGNTTAGLVAATIDMTAAITIAFTAQIATATDFVIYEQAWLKLKV